MSAIENIRRDLRTASYLAYSPVPFAGAIHDFSRPIRERFKSREHVGPYYWQPTKPGKGRGFYQSSKGLFCDKAGSTFDLRLEEANDHLKDSRRSNITGYFCDDDGQGDTLQPIIARLPHGRGFLAGWTMGAGMCGNLDCDIHETERDAAMAAHDMAERDAEREREYQAKQDQESDDETESGFETVTGTAPSHWASYLVNGDASGMDDSEIEQADAFAEWLGGNIVSCEDEGFMHTHDAMRVCGALASDCQTYTALIHK